MTNLNDNTAHDFSMYYPKGQNGNILNTNSKSEKKKVFVANNVPRIGLKSPNILLIHFSDSMIQSELRKTARQHFFFQKASQASIMTNLNDNTAHDFSMYFPNGQNGYQFQVQTKKVLVTSVERTKNRPKIAK
jgi:hypothetical protein